MVPPISKQPLRTCSQGVDSAAPKAARWVWIGTWKGGGERESNKPYLLSLNSPDQFPSSVAHRSGLGTLDGLGSTT